MSLSTIPQPISNSVRTGCFSLLIFSSAPITKCLLCEGAPCLTPDCEDLLTCIVTKETDVPDHYILKPAPALQKAASTESTPHKLKPKELRAHLAQQKKEATSAAASADECGTGDTAKGKGGDSKAREERRAQLRQQNPSPSVRSETGELDEVDEILLSDEQKAERQAEAERVKENEQLKRIKSESFQVLKKKETPAPAKSVTPAAAKKQTERKSKKKVRSSKRLCIFVTHSKSL
jgi:hypothetical protein